jgi:hypothetical protein
MNLTEAEEILKQHNYIMLEDKYMDDMEEEIEEVGGQNKDLAELKKYAPKDIEIKGKNFKFEYDDRFTITGDSWYRNDHFHGFSFKLFDNKLNQTVTSKYNDKDRPDDFSFFIKKNRDDFVNFGPVEKFLDTTIPFEIKEWEKKNKPGFFKRIFGKKNVQESYKNEIPDDVMELAEEVLNHSFYDLDWDVYTLAEMGKDWLKDYLQELNDKEMRIACM